MTLIRSCEVLAVRQCGELTGFYRGCDRCRNEVLRWLGSIEADFVRLNTAPVSAPFGSGGSGAFGSKSPANDHVIAMLDWRSAANAVNQDDREGAPLSVPAVVGEWSEYVWRDPSCEDGRPGTVGEGLAYLRRKTDWLMQQDCASDYARDVRDLYVQLRGHAEPKRKIGECPGEYAPGLTCEAPLRAAPEDDVIPCYSCGARWVRPWHDLRAAMGGQTLMDYALLSGWLCVSRRSLERWCLEDGWIPQNQEKRKLWAVVDVLASYQKRRQAKEAS
jgi:hypothetical protein